MNIRYKLCLLLIMVLPDICQNRLYRSLVLLQKECVEQYAVIYWGVAAVAIILSKARISGMEKMSG